MISIVICSINQEFFNQVEQSVATTIGLPYEIIRINNTVTNFGICKAYNEGAKKAKYDYLCFMHEDILFKSNNWGNILVDFFNARADVGLIGVAGSTYKSLVPSMWAQGLFNTDYRNIIQRYKDGVPVSEANIKKGFNEVQTLDGVFLFTKKKIWGNHAFDEDNFDKFHCYDLDFSLQVGQHHKLFVCNEILIEHFSSGSLNKDWVEYSIRLSEKWKHRLPIGNLNTSQQKEIEWRNRKIFFFRMNILGYPMHTAIQHFFRYDFIKRTSLLNIVGFTAQVLGQKLKLIKNKPFY
jgi:glycosyltransferase involved in cell wall biosynthesis